jgi:hypothetical protein
MVFSHFGPQLRNPGGCPLLLHLRRRSREHSTMLTHCGADDYVNAGANDFALPGQNPPPGQSPGLDFVLAVRDPGS